MAGLDPAIRKKIEGRERSRPFHLLQISKRQPRGIIDRRPAYQHHIGR
jgi:hypothetical protein